MNYQLKNELITMVSQKSHGIWCDNEIKSFFDRLHFSLNKAIKDKLEEACYKDGIKRNEVVILKDYDEKELEDNCKDFNTFQQLIYQNVICIKRFIDRDVTEEEQIRLKDDYKEGKENILRDFNLLSLSSQNEVVHGSISAIDVYIIFLKKGFSLEEMERDMQVREMIGSYIHEEWLKRNPNYPDKKILVPYSELDDDSKKKDLNIFDVILSVVKENYKFQNVDLYRKK